MTINNSNFSSSLIFKLCLILFFSINFKFKNVHSFILKDNDPKFKNIVENVFSTECFDDELDLQYDMLSSVEDFINLPEGGTPW